MRSVQCVLDRYADSVPYDSLTRGFLEFDRWSGDDPRLLVAEAAASTTGQSFRGGVEPAVSRFREAFVETGRTDSLEAIATLEVDDDDLVAALGAHRKRHVLIQIASVLADRSEDDDLAALRGWAGDADHYRYEADPIGSITGVGPASFQYLRQLAGIDTVRPDPTVVAFLEDVERDLENVDVDNDLEEAGVIDTAEPGSVPIDTSSPRRTIASCEWLAICSSYRMLDLDRIAWWRATDPDEREATMAAQQP